MGTPNSIANRFIGYVCVAAVLLAACVPAVAWNRPAPASGDRAVILAGPVAPTTPAVVDVLDPVIPAPQQVDPPPGQVHWLVLGHDPQTRRSALQSTGWRARTISDTLQQLHCLLTV